MTIEKKLGRINKRLAAIEKQMKASASSFLTGELEVGELEFEDGLMDRIDARLQAIMMALNIEELQGLRTDANGNWMTLERKLAQEQGLDAPSLREAAAAYAHEAWAGWMRYLFTQGHGLTAITQAGPEPSWIMRPDAYARWQRQMNTPFHSLPLEERQSDFDEADKILGIIARLGPKVK